MDDRLKELEGRLIYEPSLKIVAETKIIPEAIEEWVDEHDYGDAPSDAPIAKLVDQLFRHDLDKPEYTDVELLPEFAGRFCYRSWLKGRETAEYLDNILESGHGSVLEHANLTFTIEGVSRSFSHEMVRHRMGVAVSQESQRYVDASDMKFVVPVAEADRVRDDDTYRAGFLACVRRWLQDYANAQACITDILEEQGLEGTMLKKRVNEAAREYLPNACETRLIWTVNMRALRHVLALRGGIGADMQFQRLIVLMLSKVKDHAPTLFDDIDWSADAGVTTPYPKV